MAKAAEKEKPAEKQKKDAPVTHILEEPVQLQLFTTDHFDRTDEIFRARRKVVNALDAWHAKVGEIEQSADADRLEGLLQGITSELDRRFRVILG